MRLQDFKGATQEKYIFKDKTVISGCNGAGKTTMADAFYWLFFDKSYDLKSNPNIRPNDGRECTPTVTLEFMVGNKPVTVSKMQKRKVSKDKTRVTITNSYEVNAVEKTERDFKSYLEDIGIDFEKMLILSHPDMFLRYTFEKKTRDEIARSILFSMARNSYTDLEIAKMQSRTQKVAELLANYKMSEIEAMQKSTMRKIREDYGKDGEIIMAKIAGLESAKYGVDVSDLELKKRHFEELLEKNESMQQDISKRYEEMKKMSDGIMELKFKLGDIQRSANAELQEKRNKLNSEKRDLDYQIKANEGKITANKMTISDTERQIESFNKKLSDTRVEWSKWNETFFDENSAICSLCGQPLPVEDVEKLRSNFAARKSTEMQKITDCGTIFKNAVVEYTEALKGLKEERERLKEHENELHILWNAVDTEIKKLPDEINISDTDEYKRIVSEIKEKESHMIAGNIADDTRSQLKIEEKEIRSKLDEVKSEIFRASNNDAIDEQIAELRKKQIEYEQALADCEDILDQIKEIGKMKNNLLTEEINSNFDVVKWQFFEYQKNGEYKEICIPTINGKRFGECTNTGLEVLAKLDIVKGLQKFYGRFYPVFLDNAECLDSKSKAKIDMDCQLIMMCVSEDKELKVEVA